MQCGIMDGILEQKKVIRGKTGENQITQKYKVLTHKAVDLVKYKSQVEEIIAQIEIARATGRSAPCRLWEDNPSQTGCYRSIPCP